MAVARTQCLSEPIQSSPLRFHHAADPRASTANVHHPTQRMQTDAVGASTYHLAVRSADEEDADDRVIFALDQRRTFSDDERLHEAHHELPSKHALAWRHLPARAASVHSLFAAAVSLLTTNAPTLFVYRRNP